ncbi:MAG: cob(I)yrinic acid a,c-diamide adenosyltransferase [Armatimonadota bacterium]|nr:cob(I)yrinic acid a,c-diamide adenosyltransferase [Armatimonadota bacterium]MDW8105081.1 cob(I)yrinic acid a,c-diamide adenosyltransferase [Armatimonadota bacterium]MDW8290783.1 cob(I)yrinic acid a,c-diamide adenosyltransferase [Armatimonadota bacterium]
MRIYTKTGDDGTTGLLGGQRVSKDSPRVEAYGSVDELNAHLGLAIAQMPSHERFRQMLQQVQNDLFVIGAELAVPVGKKPVIAPLSEGHVLAVERYIDEIEEQLQPLRHFILPGGTAAAATLHVARTVCRRAERRVVSLFHVEPGNPHIITYLNRLGDLLFVMARAVNAAEGVEDIIWDV